MPLALPPVLRVVVGVALTVVDRLCVLDELSDPDGVCDGVSDDVPVPLPVLDAVGVTERLAVVVVLPVPVSEPVELGLAPRVTDAVGVRDTERDKESVDVGVSLDVGVTLDVPVPVIVTLGVVLAVCEGVSVPLGEFEGDAPCETDIVGVFNVDGMCDGVEELVPDPVLDVVPVCVNVAVAVPVTLSVELAVCSGATNPLCVLVLDDGTQRDDTVGVFDADGKSDETIVPLALK